MSSDYKQLREDFIGGHNGSTIGEVVAVTCVNQLANLLLIAVLSLFPVLTQPNRKCIRYAIEFFIIMLPFITCITILSDHIIFVCLTIILLSFIAIVLCFIKRKPKQIAIKQLLDFSPDYQQRLPFLTNLFSTLMQCVCIAILAVDFPLFSRRFAKTEIYGFSLMDVGVGCFIAVNAGFSPESRLGTDPRYSPLFLFKKTVNSTIPLIILGFQRLIAVKSLEYHEHITEYGLHWNFFFTLGLTKLFSTTFCCIFSNKLNIGVCGLILMVLYQIGLNCGLNEFIQNDNRNGLFAANKEGILSLLGNISLYLVFVEIGKYIVNIRYQIKYWIKLSAQLLVMSLMFALLTQLSHTYIENTSRREVNLAFVLWMTSLNCLFIGLEFAIQTIVHCLQYLNVFSSGDSHRSIIFSAIGYSGMLLFLVSNLLTGLINYTFHTITMSNANAFAIILTYSVILCFVSVFCFQHKIQFKIPFKIPFKQKSE